MIAAELISVRERSTATINARQFQALQSSEEAVQLIQAGVFSLVRSATRSFAIQANAYVGQAQISNQLALQITEKSPGAAISLMDLAHPKDLRISPAQSYSGEEGSFLPYFARRFLELSYSYLRMGLAADYVSKREVGQRPRGKIRVRQTALLRARGQTTQLVQDRFEISRDIFPNQLLASAIFRLCSSEVATVIGSELSREFSRLFMLFSDVDHTRCLRMISRELSQKTLICVTEKRGRSDFCEAIEMANAILQDNGLWSAEPKTLSAVSIFISLERLFEDAFFSKLKRDLSETRFKVLKGSTAKRYLFQKNSTAFRADPDAIVKNINGDIICVGDVKYKDLTDRPKHSDIYQLLAHAEAFAVKSAFLVYPGDERKIIEIGQSQGGVSIRAFVIPPQALRSNLNWLLETLLPESFEDGTYYGLTPPL